MRDPFPVICFKGVEVVLRTMFFQLQRQSTEGRGFESHLELRFFLCPLMVDSLHLPVFSFKKKKEYKKKKKKK